LCSENSIVCLPSKAKPRNTSEELYHSVNPLAGQGRPLTGDGPASFSACPRRAGVLAGSTPRQRPADVPQSRPRPLPDPQRIGTSERSIGEFSALLHFIHGRVANGTILRNSGRRTVRLKSKGDDGMNPWIRPRPSNGASFASRNTSLAGVGVFLFLGAHDAILVDTAAFDVKARLGKTKGKHHDRCVRRSDTYSEEMAQSDPSRRIAHGDSGYPVLTILNLFLSPRRLP